MKITRKIAVSFFVLIILQLSIGRLSAEGIDGSVRKRRDSLSRLAALPYLQVKSPASKNVGVTCYNEESACPGVNLGVSLCPLRAFIMDMKGSILHKWEIEAPEAWSELEERWDDYNWRNVHLFKNGDLLAVCPEMGLMKVDRDSRLLWTYTGKYIAHHDLDVDENGTIYLLTHREVDSHPGLELTGPILADYITVLTSRGEEKGQISIIDCFRNSDYAPMLDTMKMEGDILHTNTLEIIDGDLADQFPFFKAGYILIAVRELNIIAIIDSNERKVIWALTGFWRAHHHPTVLPDGNILLFDNCGSGGKKSKVIEFNPLTQEIVWTYRGDSENKFYSQYSGSCHRLPNGNTLIVESDSGRAFEVTPDKKIVWQFNNPYRGAPGEGGGSLYEVIRINPSQFSFLNKSPGTSPLKND